MKRLQCMTFMALTALLTAAFGSGAHAHASGRAVALVHEAVREVCTPAWAASSCIEGGVERVSLTSNVSKYSFRVRVGPGEHEVFYLHRVVREHAPGAPERSDKAVFLVHGDAWGFDGAFLPSVHSAAVPREQSLALFLAQGGVDVWGIDLRWVSVPEGTRDFSFMRAWNLGTHARDVRLGLSISRRVRRASGEGGRLSLLGWSRGALVAYATANLEAQLPPGLRHVGGLIPVDMVLAFGPADGALRAQACARYRQARAAYEAGQSEGGLLGPAPGLGLRLLGQLAASNPDGVSMPPFTHRQQVLAMGAATFALGEVLAPVPYYHLLGGQFDAQSGLPNRFSWTQEHFLFDVLQQVAPYQSFAEVVESEALMCGPEGGAPDMPYDDHLPHVTVPVLYVGAAGGFGVQGLHGLSRLGSADQSVLLVQHFSAEERVLDYGHADLFFSASARDEVWVPILRWLEAH